MFDPLIGLQGLGTSKDEDARDYFRDMRRHMIPFSTTQEGDRDLIELAFSKKKADDRKEWLRQFRVCTPRRRSDVYQLITCRSAWYLPRPHSAGDPSVGLHKPRADPLLNGG